MRSKHLLQIIHAKFQVNAAISVGAKPKNVGKLSFLQHFTVFKKKFAIQIISYLHGVIEGHFLISKPVAVKSEFFFFFDLSKPPRQSVSRKLYVLRSDISAKSLIFFKLVPICPYSPLVSVGVSTKSFQISYIPDRANLCDFLMS